MRLITLLIMFILICSCSKKNETIQFPDYLCEVINKIHEDYPFKLDSSTNSVVLGNFINLYYKNSKSFNQFYITLIDSSFYCEKIHYKLIDGSIDYSPKYRYIQRISIEFDFPEKDKLKLSRSTYKNDTLMSIIGVGNELGENFYLSQKNGKWIIDSLDYDMSL